MKILLFASLLCVLFISFPEAHASVVRYHYAGSSLVASNSGDDTSYFHQDRLGSNRLKTNAEGSRVSEFKSLPFGESIKNEGIIHSFTGKEQDDNSQLYYFGARYYDADAGRFSSVDPVKENHPYSYAAGNPLLFIDPDGRKVVLGDYILRKFGQQGIDVTDLMESSPALKILEDDDQNWYFRPPDNYKELQDLNKHDAWGTAISDTAIIRTQSFDTGSDYGLSSLIHEAAHMSIAVTGSNYVNYLEKTPRNVEANLAIEEMRANVQVILELNELSKAGIISERQRTRQAGYAAAYFSNQLNRLSDAWPLNSDMGKMHLRVFFRNIDQLGGMYESEYYRHVRTLVSRDITERYFQAEGIENVDVLGPVAPIEQLIGLE